MLKLLTFLGVAYLICSLTPIGDISITIIDQLVIARSERLKREKEDHIKTYPKLDDDPWWKQLVK